MHEDVIKSIYLLIGYLQYDSGSTMRITDRKVNILEYAIKYGGYERYIQTIYGAVKQAFIGRDVALEFDIQLIDYDENNKIVYKKSRADIAYVSDMETDSYTYDIEELKCYTSTGRTSFYDQYAKDIRKIYSSVAVGKNKIKYRHVVGFIGKIMSNEELKNFDTTDPLKEIKQITKTYADSIIDKELNVCGQVSNTQTCRVGNVAFCAVVTTMDTRKKGLHQESNDEMECE